MKTYNIDAIPLDREEIHKWRDPLSGGISCFHAKTNLNVMGAIDDVWVNPQGEYIVVDYKSTSKNGEVNIDAEWQISYKRQMEVYQWLFRANGFKVSSTGYFVYCNGKTDREAFDGKLEFDIKIIPYTGDDGWVEKTVIDAKKCLMGEETPASDPDCDFCKYTGALNKIFNTNLTLF
jgi:hypothetical protein